MYLNPTTLSLITTHQCTAACDHCCFHCSPKITNAIPKQRLYELIDEAKEIHSIKLIVFTGGECFLLGKDLYALINKANRLGFGTRCVSNGYWATEKNCSLVVQNLVTSGLNEINFSTGEFHTQYVPLDRIIRATIKCAESGIRVTIPIELSKNSQFDFSPLTENTTIMKLKEKGMVLLQNAPWIENNGEKKLEYYEKTSRFNHSNISGCSTVLTVLSVTPDQRLMSCCGLHMEKIEELSLGSIKKQTLSDVIFNTTYDFIKIWMHVSGPERILQFVKKHDPNFQLPLNSPHPCETCLFLYKNERAKKVILKYYKEIEDEISEIYMAGAVRANIGQRIRESFLSTSSQNISL